MKTKCAVIVFGTPASEKATEVRSLTVNRPIAVVETGNVLEREVRLETPVGQRIKPGKTAGKRVSTAEVRDIVQAELKTVRGELVLFDGFPVISNKWKSSFNCWNGAA